MICLHCGYCCQNLFVTVVDDPELGIREDNLITYTGETKYRCKHLEGEKVGDFKCRIHHYEWYEDTPCNQHTQAERKESNCRIGEVILKKYNESISNNKKDF